MQKARLIALALIAGLLITLNAQALLTPDDVPRMSIEELKQQMGSPNLVIIDVRTPHDWEDSKGKIKGSIREEPSETDSWISKYPPDKTLVFYCA
jgi:rhodanese-related sulfurtransferase